MGSVSVSKVGGFFVHSQRESVIPPRATRKGVQDAVPPAPLSDQQQARARELAKGVLGKRSVEQLLQGRRRPTRGPCRHPLRRQRVRPAIWAPAGRLTSSNTPGENEHGGAPSVTCPHCPHPAPYPSHRPRTSWPARTRHGSPGLSSLRPPRWGRFPFDEGAISPKRPDPGRRGGRRPDGAADRQFRRGGREGAALPIG